VKTVAECAEGYSILVESCPCGLLEDPPVCEIPVGLESFEIDR